MKDGAPPDRLRPRRLALALALALSHLPAATGCLSAVREEPGPEGPLRAAGGALVLRVERASEANGEGDLVHRAFLRARHAGGPRSGLTAWVAPLDAAGGLDERGSCPPDGAYRISLEGRPPDEVVLVRVEGGERALRLRARDGAGADE